MTEPLTSREALLPCPFCGNVLGVKRGQINPMARCLTEDCIVGRKMSVINLDDPVDVAAWNQRAGIAQNSGIDAGLTKAMEIVGNMRQSEAGLFDAKHSGQRGCDRSDALYDAYMAIRASLVSSTDWADCGHRLTVTPRNGAPHGAGFACGLSGGHCQPKEGCGYAPVSSNHPREVGK